MIRALVRYVTLFLAIYAIHHVNLVLVFSHSFPQDTGIMPIPEGAIPKYVDTDLVVLPVVDTFDILKRTIIS